MAVGSSVSGTAIGITTDKGEGIFARFRTMSIARTSVLTGAVVISVIRTLVGILLVFGVALLFGFRTSVGLLQWAAAAGIIVLFLLAMTWLGVAIGLSSSKRRRCQLPLADSVVDSPRQQCLCADSVDVDGCPLVR